MPIVRKRNKVSRKPNAKLSRLSLPSSGSDVLYKPAHAGDAPKRSTANVKETRPRMQNLPQGNSKSWSVPAKAKASNHFTLFSFSLWSKNCTFDGTLVFSQGFKRQVIKKKHR